MIRPKISLMMEGPDKNDNHLELSVFADKTRDFLNLLRESAKNSGEDGVMFHVVNLSHSSPATIECQLTGKDLQPCTVAFDAIRKNLDCVEEGKTRDLSHPVLSAIERFAKFDPVKVAWAEVQTVGSHAGDKHIYKFDDGFREKLTEARKAGRKCYQHS